MIRKSQLKFSGDGTSVKIVFPNRNESMEYYSQTEAVTAIFNLSEKGKIDDNEFKTMVTQVLEAENLPKGELLSEELQKGILGKALSMLGKILGNTMDIFVVNSVPTLNQAYTSKEARFEMCLSGLPHGHIYVKTGLLGGMISSKHLGFLTLKFLKDSKLIDDNEEKKLELEITNSPLPKNDPMQAQA